MNHKKIIYKYLSFWSGPSAERLAKSNAMQRHNPNIKAVTRAQYERVMGALDSDDPQHKLKELSAWVVVERRVISEKSKAYQAGFDCGMNGPNESNGHFSLFASEKSMHDWEAGKHDAEKISAHRDAPADPKDETRAAVLLSLGVIAGFIAPLVWWLL